MSEFQYIYAVEDDAGRRHYVGKTGDVKARLRHWRREFAFPIIVVLLERVTKDNWQERERYWIAYGRDAGWPLRNVDGGGRGNWEHTAEARVKISRKAVGRAVSQVTRNAVSARYLGVAKSRYQVQLCAAAQRGRANKRHIRLFGVVEFESYADAIRRTSWSRGYIKKHSIELN